MYLHVKASREGILIMPADLVPKVFEPLKFYCMSQCPKIDAVMLTRAATDPVLTCYYVVHHGVLGQSFAPLWTD